MQRTYLTLPRSTWYSTLTALLLICSTALPSPALAAKSNKSPKSQASGQKSKSVKVKHSQNNSGESQAERDRRLYRECKGLPNAGACSGYTR